MSKAEEDRATAREFKARAVKGYTEKGLAGVLDGVVNLTKRAAELYRVCGFSSNTPPAVSASYKLEAALCLAEAEELIAAVRAEVRA